MSDPTGVTLVYQPDPPHRCELPATLLRVRGSVLVCEQCGRPWHLDVNDRGIGVWLPGAGSWAGWRAVRRWRRGK